MILLVIYTRGLQIAFCMHQLELKDSLHSFLAEKPKLSNLYKCGLGFKYSRVFVSSFVWRAHHLGIFE